MELWLVDLQAAALALETLERETPRLSRDDRRRAQRLGEPRERRQRLAAYVALRIAIERMGGEALRRQPFTRSEAGKPHLGAAAPSFSLAHTPRMALLGVAQLSQIGVDLEEHRSLRLSARRRQEILAIGAGLARRPLDDRAGEAPVLQAWCRLEAYAKASGEGVGRLLSELGLRQSRGRQLAPCDIQAAARGLARLAGLSVADLRLPRGLYGSVAWTGARGLVGVRRFPADKRAIARLIATRPLPRSASARRVAGAKQLR
jgi:4'-phosphopantetheinyl transferase